MDDEVGFVLAASFCVQKEKKGKSDIGILLRGMKANELDQEVLSNGDEQ